MRWLPSTLIAPIVPSGVGRTTAARANGERGAGRCWATAKPGAATAGSRQTVARSLARVVGNRRYLQANGTDGLDRPKRLVLSAAAREGNYSAVVHPRTQRNSPRCDRSFQVANTN